MSNKLWSKLYHFPRMKIYLYGQIVIRRILLYMRVEISSMQILRVIRVHAESTDDRKSLTSLIRQSIVRSVFCMIEMYMNVLSLTENRLDAAQADLLPNKRILAKWPNKNSCL